MSGWFFDGIAIRINGPNVFANKLNWLRSRCKVIRTRRPNRCECVFVVHESRKKTNRGKFTKATTRVHATQTKRARCWIWYWPWISYCNYCTTVHTSYYIARHNTKLIHIAVVVIVVVVVVVVVFRTLGFVSVSVKNASVCVLFFISAAANKNRV